MSDGFGPIQWFDWDAVERHYGTDLPHYEIPGAVYFVTFRLHDSLPAEVMERLVAARDAFLRDKPLPLSGEQEDELRRMYSYPLECALDGGYGECVLRQPALRERLIEILQRFDGDRYQLGDYAIMPNHVHLLMRVRLDLKMRIQCRNWKSFSGRELNALLGRSGRLWQSEPFDHIVRSAAKLQQCREYIWRNPASAGLREGQFTLGRGMGFGEQ